MRPVSAINEAWTSTTTRALLEIGFVFGGVFGGVSTGGVAGTPDGVSSESLGPLHPHCTTILDSMSDTATLRIPRRTMIFVSHLRAHYKTRDTLCMFLLPNAQRY